MVTVEGKVKVECIDCCACGVVFGMPASLMRKRQEDGALFYCPNGHAQHYSVTAAQQIKELQAKLDQQKIKLSQAEARARHEEYLRTLAEQDRQDAANRLRATKGAMTRLKHRIHNGVCPCCRRTFQNLQRHMQKQHPEWETEG